MEEITQQQEEHIKLSNLTEELIRQLRAIKKQPSVDDIGRINVSPTVSFFALLYEKIRNAVEYKEEHLIRRAAIERITKRRLTLNPEGSDEAENIIRELLWARYFPNDSLSINDIKNVQKILDKYLFLRKLFVAGRPENIRIYLSQFLTDLLTCEIEETLSPEESSKNSLFTFYIYQVLKKKIKLEEISQEIQDAYFYVAVEKGYAKSDIPYLRYHLFKLSYKPIASYSLAELQNIISKFLSSFKQIDEIIANPYSDKLVRFVRKHTPPFLILYEIINRNLTNIEKILVNKNPLSNNVDLVCRQKYQFSASRLKTTAIRSLIYIFLTKMVFAFILEHPLSLYFYREVNLASIAINTLFPPFLMLLIVGLVSVPAQDNTKKILRRLIDIIDANKSFETHLAWISRKPKIKKPLLIFGFTVLYGLTFIVTLSLIYEVLSLLNFNLISQSIFLFFVSLVTFFGYRVRQIAKEYRLEEKESFFAPFVYFFFMPILSLGKILSSEIGKLNFFILIFDFLIEAPFKMIFEIVEEWISFVRARKDELV